MTAAQKAVKIALRLGMPFFVIAALGGTTMDGIYTAGRIWIGPRPTLLGDSPGRRYRALLYRRDEDGSPSTELMLEHHWHGVLLGSFVALTSTPDATVHLNWTGPTSLEIACSGCDPASTDTPERNWGRLHLSYDLR